ncbi:hypothetical protein GWI33_006831 [Rhynchophorus ferrugineus]|uniref:Uncharacterized protein n=1 Tax=Rhynchophorus ferrugineus TaxID=354439 RepID=A0A834IIG1_RHYFE|nr:hypothetical protein GWI33_006831 [Rhynchophorus ferrugineus]
MSPIATLVNEILKGLLFQKCQIPYSYNWLKNVVEKRRKKTTEQQSSKKFNITYENHFRMVSTVYDNINSIMNGILKEFCESGNVILQVVIIFGSTPNYPKEVYTLNLPAIVMGHDEKNHVSDINKHLQKILRNIFLSQSWMDSIDGSLNCTNTYIYLKRSVVNESCLNEGFQSCQPLSYVASTKKSVFCFNCEFTERTNCCYNECGDTATIEKDLPPNFMEKNICWCRSNTYIKGFKDTFVNKLLELSIFKSD